MGKKIITNEVFNQILEYLENGKTVPEISRLMNINKVTICSSLRTAGIKLNPSKGNVHYFDKIDSYSKAYIVGFIAADGALVKTKTTTTLTITIEHNDVTILEFIKSEIGNQHKLQHIVRPSSFDKTKMINHVRYTISDKNITLALNNLGITSNKSLSMGNIIENIPYKYRDAFIIGYFDGDGSVTTRDGLYPNDRGFMCKDNSLYISIRGTKKFLFGICEHLNISTDHIKEYDKIATLAFASKKDTYRFFQCYKNLKFYYIRKHDKFLSRINLSSYDKYK